MTSRKRRNKESTPSRVAIYSRKSKFTEKGDSIANQIAECRSKVLVKYPNISEDSILIYEDEGYSGATTNRPQFQQMLKDAKAKQFEALFCYRLDRVSRSVNDFLKLFEELKELKIRFVSVHDDFDADTPTGKAMMIMCSVFSELERGTIAERIRDNMLSLAKTGRWLGGNTPTGYKSVGYVDKMLDNGRQRKAFKLEAIPEEVELVKLIFSKFIESNSLTATDSYFQEKKIFTKTGKTFSRFSIKNILQNPVYMIADQKALEYFRLLETVVCSDEDAFDGFHGIMAYNKTLQTKSHGNEIRDYDEWIVAVGKHEGIISSADWIKVQTMLGQNKSKSYRKPRSHTALLSGLLYCKCGAYMRPKMSQRLNDQGEYIYSYLCETKEKTHQKDCALKNPNGNELDRMICEEIKQISVNGSDLNRELQNIKRDTLNRGDEYQTKMKQLSDSIATHQNKIASLMKVLEDSDGSSAYKLVIEQINNLNAQKESLQMQLDEIKEQATSNNLSDSDFEIFQEQLARFGTAFNAMSIEEKRTALRLLIREIVWDGENVRLYLFGSDDDDDMDLPDDENGSDELEPLRGGCERNPHVLSQPQKDRAGCLHI